MTPLDNDSTQSAFNFDAPEPGPVAEPANSIPYGYCHCGCGRKTLIAAKTRRDCGWIKGEPRAYVLDHGRRDTRIDFRDAAPFKINGVYCKLIQLTQGQFSIVWESDYAELSEHLWMALWSEKAHAYYAATHTVNERGVRTTTAMQLILLAGQLALGEQGDHINGLQLDNRRDNLRPANRRQQKLNSGLYRNNKTGFKGVCEKKGYSPLYVSQARYEGQIVRLGQYDTPEAGHFIYCWFAANHYEGFARDEHLKYSGSQLTVDPSTTDAVAKILDIMGPTASTSDAHRLISSMIRLTALYKCLTPK